MARPLDLDEQVDHFTLVGDKLELLRKKTSATRLGFGQVLKIPGLEAPWGPASAG